ncbi:protein of unknown function [Streptantibioticus cattleyicolor NRRL 8057 = DSM 46488]|nr:protein of unknown function [Streptantibioticus cattleyicolor NRRL 8057 = DSM 46488]
MNAGFWASLPLDYLLRITGRSDLQVTEALRMPAAVTDHPLAHPLLLRTLRLNCLTEAYGPLWQELYHPTWPHYENWATSWPETVAPLAVSLAPTWSTRTPLRTELERRAALVELDALVSVWLGITADQLVAIYSSRYGVLFEREAEMWFDGAGRRLARDPYAYGHGQVKEHFQQFEAYRQDPTNAPVPEGYTTPFYKADREKEMREAHAYFQKRLDDAIARGEWDPVKQEVPKP